jgi:hypothetical protein
MSKRSKYSHPKVNLLRNRFWLSMCLEASSQWDYTTLASFNLNRSFTSSKGCTKMWITTQMSRKITIIWTSKKTIESLITSLKTNLVHSQHTARDATPNKCQKTRMKKKDKEPEKLKIRESSRKRKIKNSWIWSNPRKVLCSYSHLILKIWFWIELTVTVSMRLFWLTTILMNQR